MENEPQDAYLPGSEDTLQPFDVREQAGGNGMYKLIGVGIVVALLGLLFLKLFASGTRDREQIPRILADNTPYKEVPIDRGGEQTPNQDKEIYQVLNGTSVETPVVTVPVTEEPLPKPKPRPAANVVIKEAIADKPSVSVQPKTTLKKTTTPIPKSTTGQVSGKYVVQVASLRTQSEAEAMWTKLKAKMGTVITASQYADIKRVDLGARGIYYRLRVSGLADKDAASQLCSQFKAKKQDCIVMTK